VGFGGGITRTSTGTLPTGNDTLGPFPNTTTVINEFVGNTEIRVRVPPNATSAKITITTPGGTVLSAVPLTIS